MERDVSNAPIKILALLPLTGRASDFGQPVRAGIEAACAEQPEGRRPTLDVLDSNFFGAEPSAQRDQFLDALAHTTADVIIGPLLKSDFGPLLKTLQSPVPILALNTFTDPIPATRRIWQFGLRPEDEAETLAALLKAQNRMSGLSFGLKNEWSERGRAAFRQALGRNDGQLLLDQSLNLDTSDLNAILKNALGLAQSTHRKDTIARISGLKLTFNARPSDQVQFLMASGSALLSVQIRQQCRYLYAESVPIIAYSEIWTDNALTNADLGGVYITDAPWIINARPDIQNRRQSLQNSRWQPFIRNRLFAMGLDAQALAEALVRTETPNQWPGMTGALSVSNDGLVKRSTSLAQITDDGDLVAREALPAI